MSHLDVMDRGNLKSLNSRGFAGGEDPRSSCPRLAVVPHFLFDLSDQVGAAVGLSRTTNSILPLSALLLLRWLAQIQLLVEHVLLVLQVELRVGIGDQVKLPRQQEVIEVEVIGTQVQVFFT